MGLEEFQWRKYKWKDWMVQGQSFGCPPAPLYICMLLSTAIILSVTSRCDGDIQMYG
jgi:hypothetical protein